MAIAESLPSRWVAKVHPLNSPMTCSMNRCLTNIPLYLLQKKLTLGAYGKRCVITTLVIIRISVMSLYRYYLNLLLVDSTLSL